MSSNNTTASNASAWTEVEYSARCMSPYISTPIYIQRKLLIIFVARVVFASSTSLRLWSFVPKVPILMIGKILQ